jgi:hypothetical protein
MHGPRRRLGRPAAGSMDGREVRSGAQLGSMGFSPSNQVRREQLVWGMGSVGKRSERPMGSLTRFVGWGQASGWDEARGGEGTQAVFEPSRWGKKQIYSSHTAFMEKLKVRIWTFVIDPNKYHNFALPLSFFSFPLVKYGTIFPLLLFLPMHPWTFFCLFPINTKEKT